MGAFRKGGWRWSGGRPPGSLRSLKEEEIITLVNIIT